MQPSQRSSNRRQGNGNGNGNRLSSHFPSHHQQDPQMLAQLAALAAHQQQEAAIQAQLYALNAKIIQAQTLAHANGWTVDDTLIRVWGGLTEDEIKLLKLKALREEQARREHELRMMQAQNQQGGGGGLGDQLQQNAFEIERAQAQLRALQQGGAAGGGGASSAHEQRLAAKQQIEANLRARSGRNMIKAVQQHQARMPSPPASDAGSQHSGAGGGGGGSSSSFFDRRLGSAAAGQHSPPITTTASSPSVEDPWADQKPSLGALRRHASRASESGSDIIPTSAARTKPAALVVRQPIGPPAGADELGDRNFASRSRVIAAY